MVKDIEDEIKGRYQGRLTRDILKAMDDEIR